MFKGKRGVEYTTYYTIWQIIALVMVIVIMLIAVRGLANNTTYWKKYYSTDLGLIADIENINQGDFIINYALKDKIDIPVIFKDLYFEVFLNKDHIAISDSTSNSKKTPIKTTYPFSKNKDINVLESSVISDFIVLSKIKSELMIGTYQSATLGNPLDTCPSFDTTKNMDSTKFSVAAVSRELNGQKPSIDSILGRYGKSPNAEPELTIILYYDPGRNFTIYYSNDVHELRGQKLACTLGKKYLEKYPDNIYRLAKYNDFLSSDSAFSNYISNKPAEEYWIILSESNAEKSINPNDFAIILEDAILEYYK